MTRRAFQLWVLAIACLYGAFIAVGIAFHGSDKYGLFKDLIPLGTALPAAILAGVYQRRSSFLTQLRSTWSSLLDAVQEAVQFTHLAQPESTDVAKVMKKLSSVVDDFRSLYRNLKEGKGVQGFFPFESLKDIQKEIGSYYDAKDFSEASRKRTRRAVVTAWQQVRQPILKEFDRLQPTYFDSPFVAHRNAAKQVAAAGRPQAGGR